LKNRTALTLIFLTVFIDLLGFGILIPILPTFATVKLRMDETMIGVVLAAYSFMQFLFNPLLGKLSDKYGRKPVITICLFLNAIGYVIFAFTHSFELLIISRIVGGIGGSSVSVAMAYIADVTTKENRAHGMGLIGAAFGLGFVFGPLIGGILSKYGYEITGFGAAVFSFMAFLTTVIFLPESNVNIQKSKENVRKILDVAALKRVFTHPRVGVLIILFFIQTFAMANIYGTFALIGYEHYHFTDLQNGLMYGILGLVSAIVQGGLLKVFTKFMDQKVLLKFGSITMMLGLALIPYGINFAGLAVIVSLLSLGSGILQPTILSMISTIAPETEQGITLGTNQSMSSLARVLGPFWGGFVFQYLGYQWPFLTGGIVLLFIVGASFFYIPKKLKLGVTSR
jgi:DHA1 family tetracycline resistance protein-like MFS transporter